MSRTGLTGARAALAMLTLALGILAAHPAAAQFSSQEGFGPGGAPVWRAEAQPYLWLPATSAKVGLGRAPGFDPSFTARPTLANVLSDLNVAITCNCLVRYGNWSGEINLSYISLSSSRHVQLLPVGPGQTLNASLDLLMVAPGVGYRVWHNDKVSIDLRAGFSYDEVKVTSNLVGSRLPEITRSVNITQPWIGERFDYYPTPKWRLENSSALTGLGANGGSIGWNTLFAVSYLVNKWLDLSAGYEASQTEQNPTSNRGFNNTLNVLNYGPYAAVGLRF